MGKELPSDMSKPLLNIDEQVDNFTPWQDKTGETELKQMD